MELVESERPKIKEILDTYELKDIYMDETGLFYQKELCFCLMGVGFNCTAMTLTVLPGSLVILIIRATVH